MQYRREKQRADALCFFNTRNSIAAGTQMCYDIYNKRGKVIVC
ncbi:hypothetical protein RUMGNA_01101 [Mediterraneibacter gnavus ATCC 29149]|uniref:Uncharacterized protein n=1 Tax=Mediterraneibacter gnavus (strain ATCC 29149 / DSM 114966 / JCM 6515 / VPI C7-9) TaxID=411470 RepID=A7B0M5_MEDG7|nr:hypothetical protein RUMGNA_01101 [Mediterraneibacter gnavus ATCC 29149]